MLLLRYATSLLVGRAIARTRQAALPVREVVLPSERERPWKSRGYCGDQRSRVTRPVSGLLYIATLVASVTTAAACAADYELRVPPGVATRLTPEAVAGVARGTLGAWTQQAAEPGHPVRPARLTRISLDPDGYHNRLAHVFATVWHVDAQGTFVWATDLRERVQLVIDDATGIVVAWGGH